jgi:hypothetical protein
MMMKKRRRKKKKLEMRAKWNLATIRFVVEAPVWQMQMERVVSQERPCHFHLQGTIKQTMRK